MKRNNRVIIFAGLIVILLIGLGIGLYVYSTSQLAPSGTLNFNSTPIVFDNADNRPLDSFRMDAWADNWFAAYLGDKLVIEDHVPITTERSFNAETVNFKAAYPLTLNFILKDYKANDTGLEYIGTAKQQMGDGGFIMQVTDLTTKTVVGVSSDAWRCLVIHEAPLDKMCQSSSNPMAGVTPCDFKSIEEPKDWKSASFDDSGWESAHVYTEAAVSPKDGYTQITWDKGAQLIWGPDLKTDNTLLCRITIQAPTK